MYFFFFSNSQGNSFFFARYSASDMMTNALLYLCVIPKGTRVLLYVYRYSVKKDNFIAHNQFQFPEVIKAGWKNIQKE